MKVVLFCGGLGMRIRTDEDVPKPMVKIGTRPILWHIMKYYAHHGHKDFILCLGYKSNAVKEYFLNYSEAESNDFVLTNGSDVQLIKKDISDWRITFVDTGTKASVGERLVAVKEHLKGEDVFLANYADGVTDLHLPDMIEFFRSRDKIGCFVSVAPNVTFHTVDAAPDGTVTAIRGADHSSLRINGGFFIFKQSIFDYIEDGEDLVLEPFARLISEGELLAYRHDGFWACMDTFKEKQLLEDLYNTARAKWLVWETPNGHVPSGTGSSSADVSVVRTEST